MPTALPDDGFCDVRHAGHVAIVASLGQGKFAMIASDFVCALRNMSPMTKRPFSPDWLREQLARNGTKQVDLVDFLAANGIAMDAHKMSKILSGRRQAQPAEMPLIWSFFNLDPADLAAAISGGSGEATRNNSVRNPMPNAGLPERISFNREKLPIYGVSVGGAGQSRVLFNGQQLGTLSRPEYLADVPNAYGTYVHGDSMEPRYEAGEIVIINPNKGIKKGNYVVAQVYDNDGDPPFGYVKRFLSINDKELVLEQLNPPEGEDRIMRFPRKRVLSVHRIVGTQDE
ncbi:S24 family peptidase [Methylobacterium aquaticum]|uniref:S24 family peptidase n=1 Tax=Methylobacterium aquaticum TaxID=270351 RepID=UPI003D163BA0